MPGYQYFCGANISVTLNDFWLEEAVGISYSVMNSQAPIYGYCSSLFDAVAPGQKIVQGSMVVNFVGPNYLYQVIKQGKESAYAYAQEVDRAQREIKKLAGDGLSQADLDSLQTQFATGNLKKFKGKGKEDKLFNRVKESLKEKYHFDKNDELTGYARTTILKDNSDNPTSFSRDVTLAGPFDIDIRYGGIDKGGYSQTIYSAFIVGHGSAIQIDENTIVEEYNFFARDIINN